MSSQEDITLVNLHMQVNKPIIDSPLLMASYVSHLAQVKCMNWASCCLPLGADAFSTPLFQQNEDGGLTYIGMYAIWFHSVRSIVIPSCRIIFETGCKLVPHFNTYSNWREIRIVSHSDSGNTSAKHTASAQSVPRPHPWDPNVTIRSTDTGSHVESRHIFNSIPHFPTRLVVKKCNISNKQFLWFLLGDEKEFMIAQNDTATRNSVVVKFKGNLEVTLTPLLLEGLQR